MSSVESQIKVIDKIMKEHPELIPPLKLHKMILQAQQQIRESPKRGTNVNWGDITLIDDLLQKSCRLNQSIACFIDTNIFDPDTILKTCEKVADILIENENGVKKFLKELNSRKLDILDTVGAALKGDSEPFERYGKMFEADPALILFIISSSIQPCLEEIAMNADNSFLEAWWQAPCPICGRITSVARLKEGKRYLVCTFCRAEYLTDIFLCVNCGNVNPANLKFLAPEGHPEFRIDFCEKCKHYLKVIDGDKLRNSIPKGLEDILTIDLDLIAKNAGLLRV